VRDEVTIEDDVEIGDKFETEAEVKIEDKTKSQRFDLMWKFRAMEV
jgi:hypothetical protein